MIKYKHTSLGSEFMIIRKSSIFLLLNNKELDELTENIEDYLYKIDEVFWYKEGLQEGKLYEVMFDQLYLNHFFKLCLDLGERFKVKSIKVHFLEKEDILPLLENKGFVRYEEVEYVEFKDKKKGTEVMAMRDVNQYILKVTNTGKRADIIYLLKLIARVFQIIDEGGQPSEV